MNLRNILRAQRKSGKPPTLKPRRWKAEERERLERGLCVQCGQNPAQASSYLCTDCEGENSIEDIRSEIDHLRQRILRK